MSSKALLSVALCAGLLLGACGGDPEPVDTARSTPSVAPESDGNGRGDDTKEESRAEGDRGDKKGRKPGGSDGSGWDPETSGDGSEGSSEDDAGGGNTDGGDGGRETGDPAPDGSGGQGSGGGGSGGGAAAAAYPAAGRYLYSQNGYEEFCGPGSCDREGLPPRQTVDTRYERRSDEAAVVVTEARASDSRFVRTTTHFTSRRARITEVFARFSYEGFTFSERYRPEPPVESLRFPLRDGMSWSGSWRARTSGSYRIEVAGFERVRAGGETVRAARLDTVTNFRGEYRGRLVAVLWFDPRTKATVKTSGVIRVRNALGSYESRFATTLRSAPGYG